MKGSPTEEIELVVAREADGSRLDRFVAGALGVSRSVLKEWIAQGRVTIEGVVRSASGRVRAGENVTVLPGPPLPSLAEPDPDVTFRVMHADEDVVVVDKPPGLVVHPARGHPRGTLVNGLLALGLFRAEDMSDVMTEGHVRPGIVHRLDKGTSGVMVVARTPAARESLKAQFQAHTIDRAYEALVVGEARAATHSTLHGRHPRDRLRFTTRVSRGRRAVTHVRVLARAQGVTHVECTLETGRTHQIRVHLAESGTPVLGDPLYGKPPADLRVRAVAERLGRQALHARLLGFVHPRTGERMRFEAEPPEDFAQAFAALVQASG